MQHLKIDNNKMPQGAVREIKQHQNKVKVKTVQILRNSCKKTTPNNDLKDDHSTSCTSSLRTIHIPNGSETVARGALRDFDCESLQSIIISDGFTTVGKYAFQGCKSLQSICIPDGVTTIERGAFNTCTSLVSVHIPNSVKYIGWDAFNGCESLRSIDIPNGVRTIGGRAFHGCTSLRSIHIPNGVTIIGEGAFQGCISLLSVHIPNGVRNIGWHAFYGCASLQSVHIPKTVTYIVSNAFNRCDKLEQCSNHSPNTAIWLCRRFDDLPLHHACYYANDAQSAVELLFTLVSCSEGALAAKDAMGMTPLHILCCNPRAIVEMIKVIVKGPSSLPQTDVTGTGGSGHTPMQIFLKCKSLILANEDSTPSLNDLFNMGIKKEDLDILSSVLSMNEEVDLSRRSRDGRWFNWLFHHFLSAST